MDAERTMQFILEQQAQFTSDMQELRQELRARYNEVLGLVTNLAIAQERTNEIVETIAERHVELAALHAQLAQRHDQLADQQKTVEQQLTILINTVERHISDHGSTP